MRFDRDRYLEWYLPRISGPGAAAVNLHASGVPALDASSLAPAPVGNPWAMPGLFEAALASWLGIPRGELIFTPGATGGNLLAMLALPRVGSEILVESPVYEPMLLHAARMHPVRRLERRWEDRWALGEDAADQVRPGTGLVLITEPHNPSGRFTPRARLEALAAATEAAGAWLLVNEVYRGYTDHPSLHGLGPRVVVVASLSKLLGPYVARLGWLSAAPEVVERLRWAHVNMGMASSPSAAVGLQVMARAEVLRDAARRTAADGLPRVDRWVRETPGLSWYPSEGPGFGCVRLPEGLDDVAFAERLLSRGVLVVPGSLFGAPGTLRLSWIQAGEALDLGLRTLADALR
ncbi:MAG: pyridoxal phosphate-dependent aminotransferase [Deltaproteobacteria bacterium]|nr:pyridoxal phosphate-dependent aminotransferase [Deltaproteobacteria bacterium]